ncbi:MAG: hypothetical protein A2Y12_16750 [Planctomycetes bacterium GWF2_42_9]|nr:MAG: hypothetical protein A2Y12_16750 [Planctomycetes bacterium GWF2_42_9]
MFLFSIAARFFLKQMKMQIDDMCKNKSFQHEVEMEIESGNDMEVENNLDELFKNALNTFNEDITCLTGVWDGLAYALQEAQKTSMKSLNEFVKANASIDEEKEKTLKLGFESADKILKFNRLHERFKKYFFASRILPQNSIINLIISFDVLIGSLAKNVYYCRPEILDGSDKSLKFSELVKFGDLNKAREYVIEKEIDLILRGGHDEQIEWFEKYMNNNFNFRKFVSWSNFIEICERRNLFVHSNGNISDQYIRVCKENDVALPQTFKKGDILTVDRKYFLNSCDTILELGNKLGFILWKKFLPLGGHEYFFNCLAVELIKCGNYNLAMNYLDFMMGLKPEPSGQNLLMMKINKAQCLKWQKKEEEAKQIFESIDWSPLSTEYKLVHCVLLDDYLNAIKLMQIVGKNSDLVNEYAYREWPIFKEFRKQDMFIKTFNEIYQKPYTEVEIDDYELKFKI